MAGMTKNTSSIVTEAAPTDTIAEESSEKTVQLAQAAAAVEVASPGRGAEASVIVEAGLTYELVDPVLRFTQDGGDLVVHWRDGGHTTLEDYLVFAETDLPPALTLADGTVISFDQLVASIEGFDLGAIAPAAVAPAAGLPAPAAVGGAFNTPFDGGDIGQGPGITDLLLNTGLQFGLLEFLDEVFPLSGEEVAPLTPPLADDVVTPPLADDVVTPADTGGEGIPQNVIALLGTVVVFSKELTVDGIIGDSDLSIADFGGADAETSLEDLTFTLTSLPTYGTLILVTSGGESIMMVGDTFTSADTIWWIATDEDVAEFEIVPDATFTYQVTDEDGLTADATVLITIDGEPTIGEPDAVAVDEDDLPAITAGAAGNSDVAAGDDLNDPSPVSVNGNLKIDFGPDGVGDIVLSTDGLLALGLTSGGLALKYEVSGDGHTLTAFTGAAPGDGDVFTLVITNVADGDYTFTLLDQLDHPTLDGVAGDDTENNIVFSVDFTASDGDGDTAVSSVTIDVDDDVPVNNGVVLTTKTVHEDALSTGLSTGNPEGGQTTVAVFTAAELATLVSAGADEPVTVALNGAVDGVDTGLDSKGVSILYDVVSTTQINGVADGRIVFTLVESPAGTFTFTLLDQIDHLPLTTGGGDAETTVLNLASVFTATDFDGDSVVINSGASVTIENDVPVIGSPDHGVVANTVDTAVTGDLTASVGADEPEVLSLENNTAPEDLISGGLAVVYFIDPINPDLLIAHTGTDETITANHVFTLQLNGDGTYTYTLLKALDTLEIIEIGGSASFGAGPTQAQVLQNAGNTVDLAVLSAWETTGTFSDADLVTWLATGVLASADISLEKVNGSVAGWGVNSNNINGASGTTVGDQFFRIDFDDFDDFGGVVPAPPGGFDGPTVTFATIELTFFTSGDIIAYVIHFADATISSDTITLTQATTVLELGEIGKTIDFIELMVIDGSGKFDLVSLSTLTDTGTLDLNFNVDITDEDGDTTSGVIGITVDGSTDVLDGTAGNDVIAGDDTAQTLNGFDGDDQLFGGGGNDTLIGGGGADSLDGGTGSDTASYESATSGVIANLASPGSNTGDAAGDTYTSIENLLGSDFADTLTGDGGGNVLTGADGDDMLSGDTGDDTFVYTSITDGDDTITDFVIADDTVDLDDLFDALGVVTAELRADDVKITDTGADGVLTIDGVADFSITFTGEDFGGDGTFGQFSAAQLAALGIDVGTL